MGIISRHFIDVGIDPADVNPGEVFNINYALDIGGRKSTITSVEVYPTQIRVNITNKEISLYASSETIYDMYLVDETGRRYERAADRFYYEPTGGYPNMQTYFFDTGFYGDSEELTLYITNAKWKEDYANIEFDGNGDVVKYYKVTGDGPGIKYVGMEDAEFYGWPAKMHTFVATRYDDDRVYERVDVKTGDKYSYRYWIDNRIYNDDGTYTETDGERTGTFYYTDNFHKGEGFTTGQWLVNGYLELREPLAIKLK
jgi:hypothetical protein